MEYILPTLVCAVIAFCSATLSCITANIRCVEKSEALSVADADGDTHEKENTKSKLKDKIRSGFSEISPKQWTVAALGSLLTVFACFRALGLGANVVQTIKAIVCCELVMSAAIVDLFTRKIPNKLSLAFYITGIVLLAAEFIFNREDFSVRIGSSLLGLAVGFGFLFIVSLITKGGMGMGDVKLIGGVGFTLGLAAVLYSFTYSMVICLLAAIVMLVSKRKKKKDKVPFCPFYYLGLIISVSIGTF